MSIEPTAHDSYDALPYHDRDLELFPALKAKVEAEFARERAKLPQPAPGTLHPRVPPAYNLFEVRITRAATFMHLLTVAQNSPLLAAEMERVEAHKPLQAVDMTRYGLPAPQDPNAPEEEWKRALDNAKAQLLHQRLRYGDSDGRYRVAPALTRALQAIKPRATANIRRQRVEDKQLSS